MCDRESFACKRGVNKVMDSLNPTDGHTPCSSSGLKRIHRRRASNLTPMSCCCSRSVQISAGGAHKPPARCTHNWPSL
eukprot:5179094-Amphidinium_carterae.3